MVVVGYSWLRKEWRNRECGECGESSESLKRQAEDYLTLNFFTQAHVGALAEDAGLAVGEEEPTLAGGAEEDEGDEEEEGEGNDDVDAGVEQGGFRGSEGGAGESGGELRLKGAEGGDEAGGTGGEELEIACGEGDGGEEQHGHDGDPAIASLAHFNQDDGAEAKGDDGEELVRDAEDGPKGFGDTSGIECSLIEEESPCGDE